MREHRFDGARERELREHQAQEAADDDVDPEDAQSPEDLLRLQGRRATELNT